MSVLQAERPNLGIVTEQFEEVGGMLDRLIEKELTVLKDQLDAGGVPWTPGRGVPVAH